MTMTNMTRMPYVALPLAVDSSVDITGVARSMGCDEAMELSVGNP